MIDSAISEEARKNLHIKMDGPYILFKNGCIEALCVSYTLAQRLIDVSSALHCEPLPIVTHCYIDSELYNTSSFQYEIQPVYEIKPPEEKYTSPEKLIVISDIEGNFYALQSILKSCGVIDDNYNWIFGSNHFMILGDLTDRGPDVIPCLSLVYKLDGQSQVNGGKVHYLLGNHELMNFSGDLRYVNKKYLYNSKRFDLRFQPLYNNDSVFSQWAKTKNTVELVGKTLFVHAGISPELVSNNFTLKEINASVRNHLGKAALDVPDIRERILLEEQGPLWYRGYTNSNMIPSDISERQIDTILSYYNAERIVIGHCVVPEIQTAFNNKVIFIDVDHSYRSGGKAIQALMIEGDSCAVVDSYKNTRMLLN